MLHAMHMCPSSELVNLHSDEHWNAVIYVSLPLRYQTENVVLLPLKRKDDLHVRGECWHVWCLLAQCKPVFYIWNSKRLYPLYRALNHRVSPKNSARKILNDRKCLKRHYERKWSENCRKWLNTYKNTKTKPVKFPVDSAWSRPTNPET